MEPRPNKLEVKDGQLVIEWSDGVKRQTRFSELRKVCPCATCREQRAKPPQPSSGLNVLSMAETKPLTITGMRPVGNYAYAIEFSDGHDTGIFTLDFLSELGSDVTE